METILSVVSVVLIVKMSVATHEVTQGHQFAPCEAGGEQLVCPDDRQCIHRHKVMEDIALYFLSHAVEISKVLHN